MASFRYGLSAEQVIWIEDQLSNNKVSSDEEMREYFNACGLTPEQADLVLIHRRDYLVHTYLRGHGPLHSPSFFKAMRSNSDAKTPQND